MNYQRQLTYRGERALGSEGPELGLRSLVKVSDNAGSEVVSEQKIHITSQSAGRERLVPTVPLSNTSLYALLHKCSSAFPQLYRNTNPLMHRSLGDQSWHQQTIREEDVQFVRWQVWNESTICYTLKSYVTKRYLHNNPIIEDHCNFYLDARCVMRSQYLKCSSSCFSFSYGAGERC